MSFQDDFHHPSVDLTDFSIHGVEMADAGGNKTGNEAIRGRRFRVALNRVNRVGGAFFAGRNFLKQGDREGRHENCFAIGRVV